MESKTMNVDTFKIDKDNKVFKKGQRVWVQKRTGNLSARVIGKYKGRGRYVSCWVSYDEKEVPYYQTFEVEDNFADRLDLVINNLHG